jgi:hypothetical protein
MENEIQNSEFTLPGNLGSVLIASTGKVSNVTKVLKGKDGSTTITLSEVVDHYLNGVPETEDAEYEIVEPKQLPKINKH